MQIVLIYFLRAVDITLWLVYIRFVEFLFFAERLQRESASFFNSFDLEPSKFGYFKDFFIFICGATPRTCETARCEPAKSDGRPYLDLDG